MPKLIVLQARVSANLYVLWRLFSKYPVMECLRHSYVDGKCVVSAVECVSVQWVDGHPVIKLAKTFYKA